jgi:hypothetical protein
MFLGAGGIEMICIDIKDKLSALPSLISSYRDVVEGCRVIDTMRSHFH